MKAARRNNTTRLHTTGTTNKEQGKPIPPALLKREMFVASLLFLNLIYQGTVFPTVRAQSTWSGCVMDPSKPGESVVRRGKKTPVCIVVSPGGDWTEGMTYTRYFWTPTADEYSKITIENSYSDLVRNKTPNYTPEVSVHVQSQKVLTFIRRWHDEKQGRIFPYLTAIIAVKDGVVQYITYDDGCIFCGSSRCVENSYNFNGTAAVGGTGGSKGCFFSKDQCEKIWKAGGTQCDLTIFAVWQGTDADGKVLDSFNSRFSAFPSANVLQSLKDNIETLSENVQNTVQDTVQNVQNTVQDTVQSVQDNFESAQEAVQNVTDTVKENIPLT